MSTKVALKTTFEEQNAINPIFTGGSIGLDNRARILATTLGDDAVLTDWISGKRLAQIEGDGEPVSCLALTSSASHLIVASRSLSMKTYALVIAPDRSSVDATLVRTQKPHATPAIVLAVDRTSTFLATGAADGYIKVWDIAGGYVTHTFRGPSVLVSALHFFELAARDQSAGLVKRKGSRKGKKGDTPTQDSSAATVNYRLASGSQDGKVRVWDLHKRSIVANLDSHVSDVRGIDYSPEQALLVTAGRDRTIMWWDVDKWQTKVVKPVFELVEAVGFLNHGRVTYSAGMNGNVRLWRTDTAREITREQAPEAEIEAIVSAVAIPESNLILCARLDHTLTLYRAPHFEKDDPALSSGIAPLVPLRRVSGTHDDILDLEFLLPDHALLALSTNSEDVRVVSVVAEPPSTSNTCSDDTVTYFGQDIAVLKGHGDIVVTLDVDWSGHWIATGSKDNTARLWRIESADGTHSCHATLSGHAQSVGAVSLPKIRPPEDSKAFRDPLQHPPAFLLTGSQDQTIKKWEVPRILDKHIAKPRALYTRKAHDKDINALDVNSTGALFASASQDKLVKIWDAEAGEVQGILRGHRRGVWSVKFAPPDLPVIQGDSGATASGKGVVLTGSGDKTIKLWSLHDYTCLRTFEGHTNSVLQVAWLRMPREGKSKKRAPFASAGGDGLVKVWDANTGETECTLDNHEDKVWALTVDLRTNTIVSGAGDSVVTFWKDTTAETHAAATQAAIERVEQEQELNNHIHAGSYREAILLALQLNHPGRLLSLFTKAITTDQPDPDSLCGLEAVDEVLGTLTDEQIFQLLLRLRDWNTNARTAPVAQRILWTLLRSYPASKFSNLSVKGMRGQTSLKEMLNVLQAYTERHYKRMEELIEESFLVEYTLQGMDSLASSLDMDVGEAVDVEMDDVE